MKICPVVAQLFYAEGRTERPTDRQTDRPTDMTKLIVTFYNFTNAPKENFIFLWAVLTRSLWYSQQTETISLNDIHLLVFIRRLSIFYEVENQHLTCDLDQFHIWRTSSKSFLTFEVSVLVGCGAGPHLWKRKKKKTCILCLCCFTHARTVITLFLNHQWMGKYLCTWVTLHIPHVHLHVSMWMFRTIKHNIPNIVNF
jgi:hypothetical protein